MASAAAGPAQRPREVETAFWLSVVAMGVQLVMWVLDVFVIAPTGLEQMREADGQRGAVVQVAISGGVTVVATGLWLCVAVMMRAGRNWARILLAVGGALSVFFLMNSLGMSGFAWEELVRVAPDALATAAIVLLFLPPSQAYFSPSPRTA
ncbi:hypothetical protein [Streptomyces sp. NPDC051776]|uniref:hypothetical protein n=1 Tax=Streptomyces sp. NPDC051776 TaxID=3155414 RepID=UPI00343B03FF